MDVELDKLSYIDRKMLIFALNKNNAWKELAVTLQFLDCEMNKITTSESPSEILLDIWGGKYGHTVLELFVVLKNHKLYSAMTTLKAYIPEKYHKFIKVDPPDENNTPAPPVGQPATQNKQRDLSETRVVESAGSIPLVSYHELEECTTKWSTENVLGRGGYATVFKGKWKNTVVAIKRIEARRDNSRAHDVQLRQSISELQYLNSYRHENILPIYAYSIGGPYPCLVYQFMSGGSLDKRIHTKDPNKFLQWQKRLDIAIGAARGLQYLHTLHDKPLIHVDIKPANILLDASDTPKIGDFGLARLGPNSNQVDVAVSHVFGTPPYLPRDYINSKRLNPKLDVYSFGVMLFEMATGLPVVIETQTGRVLLKDHVMSNTEEENKAQWIQLKDKRVAGGEKIFVYFVFFGKACVDPNADMRPTMVTVLQELERCRE